MDFRFTEEIEMLRKTVRDFVQTEVESVAMEIEEKDEIPAHIVEMSKAMGLFGLSIPDKYGGLELDMVGKCAIYEELGKTHNGFTTLIGAHTGIGSVGIVELGTEEQKQKFLRPLAEGKKMGAYCLTESGSGSDSAGMRTTAVKDGDDYILNGSKIFITNAGEAEIYVVFAVTDPTAKHKGITAFIVEKGTPGFSMGKKEKKLGIRSSPTLEVVFEDVRVPKENMLGEEGQGFKIAMMTLDGGRNGIAAQALGIAQGAYEHALHYAKERNQFGKPIAALQAIQFKLADMATKIEVARLLTYQAAWLEDQGLPYGKASAMSKVFAGDTAMEVTTEAVQVFGGYGYTREYPVERFMRDAKITQIYEGTNEIQRLVISNYLLKE